MRDARHQISYEGDGEIVKVSDDSLVEFVEDASE